MALRSDFRHSAYSQYNNNCGCDNDGCIDDIIFNCTNECVCPTYPPCDSCCPEAPACPTYDRACMSKAVSTCKNSCLSIATDAQLLLCGNCILDNIIGTATITGCSLL